MRVLGSQWIWNPARFVTRNPPDSARTRPENPPKLNRSRCSVVHVPGSDEQVGQLTAVDLATGRTLWEHRQRAGIGGSVLTTGGGLVFVADDARRLRAFHAETGEILLEQLLNSTAGGFPVSYMVDGIQYVAIASGGGPNYRSLTPEIRQRSGGNTLFVFRLP